MVFASKEKKAINCLIVKLMKADGHTDISEAIKLFEISKIIDININEADNSLQIPFDEAKVILQNMKPAKKEFVRNLFNEMAMSDGNVGNSENELISNIFS